MVHTFRVKCTYKLLRKYDGSRLDGRDIGSVVVKLRFMSRFKELKARDKKINYKVDLKSIKKRDKSDKNRKISPLKKTKDMHLIN